jgi:hypothetical protein
MRRAAPLCLLALLVAAQPLRAQEPGPARTEVPAGPGTIRGRVVHREDAERSLGGITVLLHARTRTGLPGIRHGVSDEEGRFAFEGISNDPATSYLIGAQYQGVFYLGARVRFSPEEIEHEVEIPVAEVRVDPDSFSVAEARLILTLDDAALAVRESHVLKVDGDAGVMAAPGESLLRIRLPEAIQNLRFSSDAAGLSLERLPDGGLAVAGAAPPGESTVAVEYRIPVAGSSVDLVRSFERRVPLLSVYLADTGHLIPESSRLHRRRPLRTGDLTYIHLEAFNVTPGEEVALRISTRPRSRGSSPGGVMAFVVLAGLLSGALLIAPLLGNDLGAEDLGAEELPGVRERESIYSAIRDLEHDHETGKIADADYAAMRDELRARAVDLLRRERQGAVDAEASVASPRCAACGSELRTTDRFCSHCGQAVAGRPADEAKA